MFSHVTIGVNDIPNAKTFYDNVLAALDLKNLYAFPEALGYGPSGNGRGAHGQPLAQLWIMHPFDGQVAQPGNGITIALLAPSRNAVDAFYKAVLAGGGRDEGQPGLRTQYHPHYYATYVRDLEGNKLCAVCHLPP